MLPKSKQSVQERFPTLWTSKCHGSWACMKLEQQKIGCLQVDTAFLQSGCHRVFGIPTAGWVYRMLTGVGNITLSCGWYDIHIKFQMVSCNFVPGQHLLLELSIFYFTHRIWTWSPFNPYSFVHMYTHIKDTIIGMFKWLKWSHAIPSP
jgi:hypothetical protein